DVMSEIYLRMLPSVGGQDLSGVVMSPGRGRPRSNGRRLFLVLRPIPEFEMRGLYRFVVPRGTDAGNASSEDVHSPGRDPGEDRGDIVPHVRAQAWVAEGVLGLQSRLHFRHRSKPRSLVKGDCLRRR